MGAVRSQNTELKQTIEDQKNEVLGKIVSQESDLQDKITSSKNEILASLSEDIMTPNITFRAYGINTMGDPGKLHIVHITHIE